MAGDFMRALLFPHCLLRFPVTFRQSRAEVSGFLLTGEEMEGQACWEHPTSQMLSGPPLDLSSRAVQGSLDAAISAPLS